VALGVGLALALRMPWLDAALGRDEGGAAFIALAWHHSGPYAYGSYFLDRPPLLLLLFKLAAGADGATGVRLLGALAAVSLVALCTLLAVRVAGARAAPWAALISAALTSSLALQSVYTPGELLAAVPSTASVLCVVAALERGEGARWSWSAAGALAAGALLVKQSFGDALVAGVVALLAAGLARGVGRSEALRRVASYLAGVAATVVAVVVWALVMNVSGHDIWYALVGFRLDAASVLATGAVGARLTSHLGSPLLYSGLGSALALAAVGVALLRDRPAERAALGAWLLAGAAGIVLGGVYWPHYLIELAPAAAVGAAALLARRALPAALALCLVLAPGALYAAGPIRHDRGDQLQQSAVTVGRYLRDRAEPGQTDYMLYARADILYYSGLRDPFPYNWTLMIRAVPHAREKLYALLASPRRPTWIVKWDPFGAYGMNRHRVVRLMRRHYRRVASVCHHSVYLERGRGARPAPARAGRCGLGLGKSDRVF
jgi:4-amino-4-deoxy-L-arabinose transferase-like glycosyltransferase